MLDALQEFTMSLPPLLQWAGVALVSAIPFVESYFGSVLGVLSGMNPVVAILAAVVGNVCSMLLFVLGAHRVRSRMVGGRAPVEPTPRRRRLRNLFDKYGVAGVSLLGQTVLPSQITSAAMVSFGAPKNVVILWQIISIVVWGAAFGILAWLGFSLVA